MTEERGIVASLRAAAARRRNWSGWPEFTDGTRSLMPSVSMNELIRRREGLNGLLKRHKYDKSLEGRKEAEFLAEVITKISELNNSLADFYAGRSVQLGSPTPGQPWSTEDEKRAFGDP